jgi:hypothetical protein
MISLIAVNTLPPAEIALKLLEYCRSQNWSGWDPYDALNSRVFQACKFLHFKYPRLALTQLLKRSPINIRPLLLVPREQNPKGIALFLSAAVKLTRLGLLKNDTLVRDLTARLLELQSPGYAGWGYHFDWQTRGVLVPRGSPNIVCTTFACNALLDAHSLLDDLRLLDVAGKAARFLLDSLYDDLDAGESCFNYYLKGRSRVHNANLLGAAFLCRVARTTSKAELLVPALKAARFSVSRQRADGAWGYGEAPTQSWVDNFHSGYNLCALRRIGVEAETSEFQTCVHRGMEYYIRSFFDGDGAPKYFDNARHPLDIHSAAQSITTLVELRDRNGKSLEMVNQVLRWTIDHLWSGRGYFYYQEHPWGTNRIPYMRWSQAWMLLALSTLLTAGVSPRQASAHNEDPLQAHRRQALTGGRVPANALRGRGSVLG